MGTFREHHAPGAGSRLSYQGGSQERTVNHCIKPRFVSRTSLRQVVRNSRQQPSQSTHLSVIRLTRREERLEGIVPGNEESRKVNEELARDVEKDQEKVDANDAQERINLGDRGLPLKLVEDGILGQLLLSFFPSSVLPGIPQESRKELERTSLSSWAMLC